MLLSDALVGCITLVKHFHDPDNECIQMYDLSPTPSQIMGVLGPNLGHVEFADFVNFFALHYLLEDVPHDLYPRYVGDGDVVN